MQHMKLCAPADDLEQRRPVWEALSMLFLDTELTETDFAWCASVVADSPYTDEELAAIYHAEVYPVCRTNIGMAPGYWSGFPDGWVEGEILARGLDASRVLAIEAGSLTKEWGWGGLQQRVMERRRAMAAARSS